MGGGILLKTDFFDVFSGKVRVFFGMGVCVYKAQKWWYTTRVSILGSAEEKCVSGHGLTGVRACA